VVALVRGVHGLRGAIRVEVLTDHPETRFVPGAVLHREGSDAPLTIVTAEAVADGPGWRLRFGEVGSREAADRLRGVYLQAAVMPELELGRGEYYWHEVMGVTVRGVDGTDLGTVRDVYRIGENEVFSVEGGPYGAFELPAVRAFVRVFAPRRGEIVIDTESLDLRPPRVRDPDPDRPKAPRRTTRRPKGSAPAPATEPAADAPVPLAEPPAPAQAVEPSASEP
jgi:16S rRNA processing protein RimM